MFVLMRHVHAKGCVRVPASAFRPLLLRFGREGQHGQPSGQSDGDELCHVGEERCGQGLLVRHVVRPQCGHGDGLVDPDGPGGRGDL